VYNGEDDDEKFWQYVIEANQYIEDGEVPWYRQVDVAARHTSGRARQFYNQNVLTSNMQWRLDRWYQELFDYCFPVNYRETCRAKLRRCYQNGRDVRDYYYELNRYWNALGEIMAQARTIRFWEGLDGWLEEELICDDYDPDIHTLAEIYARAQTLQHA
ncbi:hypothetical protein FISHEDRAFT_29351, partial [Fistulina hepatica ATCC 64428]